MSRLKTVFVGGDILQTTTLSTAVSGAAVQSHPGIKGSQPETISSVQASTPHHEQHVRRKQYINIDHIIQDNDRK